MFRPGDGNWSDLRTEACNLRGMYIAAPVEIDCVAGLPRRRKSYTLYDRCSTEEHDRPELHLAADHPVGLVMSLVEREAKFSEYLDQDRASGAHMSRHRDTMNKSNRKLTARFPEPCSAEDKGGGTSVTSISDGALCSIEKNARP